jgi:pimeloyl-ACP methyl ester carboxylesterase
VLVQAGDVRLYFEVFGQQWAVEGRGLRTNPVLVGLHGGPGLDGTELRYDLAPLADVAEVVVPDQRGHGRSSRSEPETWNLSRWADDVKSFCDALGIEHPIVLGASFGGFVAQQYGAMHPGHPAGLILVSTSPRFSTLEELMARFREVGGEEAADVVRRDWEAPSEETAAEWERVIAPLCARRADPLRERLTALRIRTMEVNFHFMQAAKTMDLRPGLRAVRCPVLILSGEHDPLTTLQLGREIVDALPANRARLHVVPDAAHEVFSDNPGDVYGTIRDFIQGLPPPTDS